MAAGMTAEADNLGLVDDLVTADEGETAASALLTEVVTTATAVPSATAAA